MVPITKIRSDTQNIGTHTYKSQSLSPGWEEKKEKRAYTYSQDRAAHAPAPLSTAAVQGAGQEGRAEPAQGEAADFADSLWGPFQALSPLSWQFLNPSMPRELSRPREPILHPPL